MGQRVKIQYSVELSDLQDEVNRLYKNIMDETNTLVRHKGTTELKLETSSLDKIHSLRESLAKMDIMLDDLQQIIVGYINYRVPTAQPENPQELADQITKFKELISENTD